jgi:chromosome partitioning protein
MVIAVVNSKGGVGKSTIAVHAAVWLRDQGFTPAVVDVDAQGSTSDWLARAAPDIRLERCDTTEELAERLPRLTRVFDIVLADGPAALSRETVILAAGADLVLMPICPSMMDIRASYRTARLIYKIRLRDKRGDLPRVFTVLNRVQPRTRLAHIAVEAVRKYGFPVASTPLRLRQAYAIACGLRTVVWRMGAGAQAAAEEMTRLFTQVLDRRTLDAARQVAELEGAAYRSALEIPESATPSVLARTLPADRVVTASYRSDQQALRPDATRSDADARPESAPKG